MLKLIVNGVRRFLWDEQSAAASLRSLLAFVVTVVASIVATAPDEHGLVNVEQIRAWGWKGWGVRFVIGAVMAGAFRLKAGEKNPTHDEIRTIVSSPPGATPVPGPGA